MKNLDDIIDEALRTIGETSDAQLAKRIGITRQSVNQWRHRTAAPDMFALMELQKILGRDARELSAIIEAERAKTEERRGYWEEIKKSFSTKGVSSAVALATAVALLWTPQHTHAGSAKLTAITSIGMYIM
ncbi:helix-turn-helix domain-containing protein [Chitiniphilus eburneus]|uniref:helix-turn-helix domain-containing protein n=1 Tax=Chitiniphilus eburneus TaxID=2571148 RepID=UPI0035D001AF